MPLNDDIADQIVHRTVRLEHYKNGLIKDVLAALEDALQETTEKLQRLLGEKSYSDLKKAELVKLQKALEGSSEAIRSAVEHVTVASVDLLAENEFNFTRKILHQAVPSEYISNLPQFEQVLKSIKESPFDGRTLGDWFNSFETGVQQDLKRQVTLSLVQNEGAAGLTKRLLGTKSLGFKDGVQGRTRRSAEAVARTAISHTANSARDYLYQSSDIVKGVRWTATLDARTTVLCASLDGRVFPVDSGPRPPAHVNCRSTITPVLKSWKELGIPADELEPGTRASMNGQVPDKTSYGSWLKRQKADVQDEVLGKGRAALFRKGEVSIEGFVNEQGRTLSLDELSA